MDIVVRGDAVDALGLISGDATSTHLDLLLLGDSLKFHVGMQRYSTYMSCDMAYGWLHR